MRPLTLTAVVLMAICLSSCSATWQYMTLNSHEVTKDSLKRFTWENDTLRLVYNYNGYGGPFWLSVHNKMDKPMYINWKKSAVINSGYALSLSPSDVKLAATLDATRGYVSSSGTLAGTVSVPPGMDFIPPGATIIKEIDVRVGYFLARNKLTGVPKVLKVNRNHYDHSSYELYSYTEAVSPMQFKTYLTFVLDTEQAKEFAVNHTFYASEVIQTGWSPAYFGGYRRAGDVLYVASH